MSASTVPVVVISTSSSPTSVAVAPGSVNVLPTSIVIGLSPVTVIVGGKESSTTVIVPVSNASLEIFWLVVLDNTTFVMSKLYSPKATDSAT